MLQVLFQMFILSELKSLININENQENINEKKQQNLNNDSSSSGKKHKKRHI